MKKLVAFVIALALVTVAAFVSYAKENNKVEMFVYLELVLAKGGLKYVAFKVPSMEVCERAKEMRKRVFEVNPDLLDRKAFCLPLVFDKLAKATKS